MASPTAQRKRLLEDQMTSAEFRFKAAKRELIAELDQAKIDRGSEDSTIRCQAESQYNGLLTRLHCQNQTFDQLLLDLKSQIYDLEAHEFYQASHKPTAVSACPSPEAYLRDSGPQSATRTSPRLRIRMNCIQKTEKSSSGSRLGARSTLTKDPAAPLQINKTMTTIERLLHKSSGFDGFSYLPSCSVLVREHAQKGRRRNRWLLIHCAACGSTVNSTDDFFRGVTGLFTHITRTSCQETCDVLDLKPWDYIVLHCMQEVNEEYVVMATSGQVEVPKIRAEVSKLYKLKETTKPKETKEQAAERVRISRLQSNNPFYSKPPPRKHVPVIIDLDGDTEPPEEQSSSSADQQNIHRPQDTQHPSPPTTPDLETQLLEALVRGATEPLIDTTKIDEVASPVHGAAINQEKQDVTRSGSA